MRRHAVIDAFHWLRRNNPLYERNIAYNGTDDYSETLKKLMSKDQNDVPNVEPHEE